MFRHKEGSFPRLTNSNYASWSTNCEFLLCALGLWEIITDEEEEPEEPEYYDDAADNLLYVEKLRDYTKRSFRAMQIIHNSVSAELRPHISELRNPGKMWDSLEHRCSSTFTPMERMGLKIQLRNLVRSPGAPIRDYFAQLTDIRNRLARTPQAITDDDFKVQLYSSLPPEFDTTCTYQQNLPYNTPIETIMDNIKRDETMRSLRNKPAASTEALFSKSSSSSFRGRGRGRGGRHNGNTGKWCTHCQHNSHTTEECWAKHSNKRSRDDDDNVDNEDQDVVCWYCGDQGHRSTNCPIKRRGRLAKSESSKKRKIGNSEENEMSANLTIGTRSAGNGQ